MSPAGPIGGDRRPGPRTAGTAARRAASNTLGEMNEIAPGVLRVGYVPGVTVSKWARIWAERFGDGSLELIGVPQAEQETALRQGRVEMCFVRLPIEREGMHAIPLYAESAVVVVPKDHPVALFEQIGIADLADERMQDAADIDALAGTVELVAAVGGAAIMPHSLARLHHRRDLVYRTVADAPSTQIALAWPVDRDSDVVQDFIGVVRGRTARSTRGRQQEDPAAGTGVAKAAAGDNAKGRGRGSASRTSATGRSAAQSGRKSGAGKPKAQRRRSR